MKPDDKSAVNASNELGLLFLVPTLFAIARSHDRFPYFIEAMIELLDHICPGPDSNWDRYSRLLRDAHSAGLTEIRSRQLYQEIVFISKHHTFASSCTAWKFNSLTVFIAPEERVKVHWADWLGHIDNTLSYMEGEPETTEAMCDFVLDKLRILTEEIGIEASEWLQPPKPLVITDEMVDAWIEDNADVHDRLQEFGL